jgi:hypothetical protein
MSEEKRGRGRPPGGKYGGGGKGAPALTVRLEPDLKERVEALGGATWIKSLISEHIGQAEKFLSAVRVSVNLESDADGFWSVTLGELRIGTEKYIETIPAPIRPLMLGEATEAVLSGQDWRTSLAWLEARNGWNAESPQIVAEVTQ